MLDTETLEQARTAIVRTDEAIKSAAILYENARAKDDGRRLSELGDIVSRLREQKTALVELYA